MPSINFDRKKEVEWADIAVFYGGAEIAKLEGIRYRSSKEIQELYGAGDKPIGLQAGNRAFGGELKVLKGVVDTMNAVAKAALGQDLLDLEADITVTYRPIGGLREIQSDKLIGVRITEYEKGMEQGATSMPITLPFKCLDIQ